MPYNAPEALSESALEQCIYLFVEGESEERAFWILLEEGFGISFEKNGIVIANYNGIGNLKHTIRLMQKTLSHTRPMIFTFDDDRKDVVSKIKSVPTHVHLFKVPCKPVVTLPSGDLGGSFEESFEPSDFIDACFETTLLKNNTHITKSDFMKYFDKRRPYYSQIVCFLQKQGMHSYLPSKIEIAEEMAVSCNPIPDTYRKLAELIQSIRNQSPVRVKI